ncbi:hypothetical protein ES332_A09G129900v1 [Gossypium tomentosum]|uniref:Uncharacterized protein n=1 Tax=Gossypium tomentosum TaxID=34277 RepID=A0A5D2P1U6_GOSTO|nr:hypothetical protein ES332_A09G129900v1 [Gossypium tomentosum]
MFRHECGKELKKIRVVYGNILWNSFWCSSSLSVKFLGCFVQIATLVSGDGTVLVSQSCLSVVYFPINEPNNRKE